MLPLIIVVTCTLKFVFKVNYVGTAGLLAAVLIVSLPQQQCRLFTFSHCCCLFFRRWAT